MSTYHFQVGVSAGEVAAGDTIQFTQNFVIDTGPGSGSGSMTVKLTAEGRVMSLAGPAYLTKVETVKFATVIAGQGPSGQALRNLFINKTFAIALASITSVTKLPVVPPPPAGPVLITAPSPSRSADLPSGPFNEIAEGLLARDAKWSSPGGTVSLVMQSDGNIVLYENSTGKPLWNSETYGSSIIKLAMQSDGNLVGYAAGDVPLWNTGTYGTGAKLRLYDNGGFVLAARNSAVWNAGTSVTMPELQTPADWDEAVYLTNNPDVAVEVRAGRIVSGYWHYFYFGKAEGRAYAAKTGGTIQPPPPPTYPPVYPPPPGTAVRKIKSAGTVTKGELFMIERQVSARFMAALVGAESIEPVKAYPGMTLQKDTLYEAAEDMDILGSVTSALKTAAKSKTAWGILGITAAAAVSLVILSRRQKK